MNNKFKFLDYFFSLETNIFLILNYRMIETTPDVSMNDTEAVETIKPSKPKMHLRGYLRNQKL